jgi:hypothetical protein
MPAAVLSREHVCYSPTGVDSVIRTPDAAGWIKHVFHSSQIAYFHAPESILMSTERNPDHRNIIPTVVGLLGGAVAMGWLWIAGELDGYGVSAYVMLYVIVGGTITLALVLFDRLSSRL